MRMLFFFSLLLVSCQQDQPVVAQETDSLTIDSPALIADSFDFPVGKPDAEGYYDAQPFRKNDHLGEDWNGVGGGDTDMGDPVYATANGRVFFADHNGVGWGNVIRILHFLSDSSKVESLYAHCGTMYVMEGEWVEKGTLIGTIGNADGYYPAHLHFEIRDKLGMPIGGGYSSNNDGFVDPSRFIADHR